MSRAAIFDIDGTLIDSVALHAEAWVAALAHFHVTVTFDAMRHEIGKGGDQLLPQYLPGDKLAAEREQIAAYRGELFKARYLDRVKAFPSVPELFRALRNAGVAIALASSGKADEVKRYVEIAGVTGLVDVQTTADDAEASKPAPDIFLAAMTKLAPIAASDAVVIGDSPWDIIAAKRAGLRSVGVLCGGFAEAELREAGASAIYRDPADLLANLKGSPLLG